MSIFFLTFANRKEQEICERLISNPKRTENCLKSFGVSKFLGTPKSQRIGCGNTATMRTSGKSWSITTTTLRNPLSLTNTATTKNTNKPLIKTLTQRGTLKKGAFLFAFVENFFILHNVNQVDTVVAAKFQEDRNCAKMLKLYLEISIFFLTFAYR